MTFLILLSVLLLAGCIGLGMRVRSDAGSFRRVSGDQVIASRLLADREKLLEQAQARLAVKQAEILELSSSLARAGSREEALVAQLDGRQQEIQKIQEHFRLEFEQLANRIFEQKSEKFTRQNQENLDQLLKPLQERIKDFEKKVEEAYHSESRERFSLQQEVKKLADLNQVLGQEAANLTRALKTDTRTQGNWGEMILERVLELSGLVREVHYQVQQSSKDEEGNRKRPDVILLLPDSRKLIIDSKVSLTAFEQYCSATTESARLQALKDHLESVRQHISGLSAKDYPDLYPTSSPDFVLLFIPLEPAYSLAIQQDQGLYDYAFRKNIILVSVFNLLATLRLIHSMWRLDSQNRHAQEIVQQGSRLYEKFVGFAEDLKAIGSDLDQAGEHYRDAMNKLSEGKGNLVQRAEQMKALGLDPKKQIPEDLVSRSREIGEP
ncbi:MAG TPA: DNA recombination protein RmuC [Chitinophagaceae bacterium]|nr:DNA recombination protein RmuC [Chitinophagaceae bacterium]